MELGAKPVIAPTNQYPTLIINHCDIVFISQVQNFATYVTFRDCILGVRNPHSGRIV